jgi:hypothetical protein
VPRRSCSPHPPSCCHQAFSFLPSYGVPLQDDVRIRTLHCCFRQDLQTHDFK